LCVFACDRALAKRCDVSCYCGGCNVMRYYAIHPLIKFKKDAIALDVGYY